MVPVAPPERSWWTRLAMMMANRPDQCLMISMLTMGFQRRWIKRLKEDGIMVVVSAWNFD